MMEPIPKRKNTLSSSEAIALWQKGKNVWNAWVDNNPKSNIDFKGIRFPSKETREGINEISFTGYRFPNGKTDFTGAIFEANNISFLDNIFGTGSVCFEKAEFKATRLSFNNAIFNGATIFIDTIFYDTAVDFRNAKFVCSSIYFHRAKFGKGFVHFGDVDFGETNADFRTVEFGEGNVYFDRANFSRTTVNFSNAKFGGGEVRFYKTDFGQKHVSFDLMVSQGLFTIQDVNKVTTMSFKGASFGSMVNFDNFSLPSILDLVGTKLTHQISLHGFSCSLRRERSWRKFGLLTAKDKEDIARLNRLKELAETNKHHQVALKFHADEHRARRWVDLGMGGSILDIFFSAICNYGQSVKRPFMLWLLTIFIFYFVYLFFLSTSIKTATHKFDIFLFSAANCIPFLTSTRKITDSILQKFSGELLNSVYALMIFQGFVSSILIFLIGLGLRNRFRI